MIPDDQIHMSHYRDVDILCPFYKAQNDRVIACEGVIFGSKLSFRINQRSKHREYVHEFCENRYKDCLYYKAAEKKYE